MVLITRKFSGHAAPRRSAGTSLCSPNPSIKPLWRIARRRSEIFFFVAWFFWHYLILGFIPDLPLAALQFNRSARWSSAGICTSSRVLGDSNWLTGLLFVFVFVFLSLFLLWWLISVEFMGNGWLIQMSGWVAVAEEIFRGTAVKRGFSMVWCELFLPCMLKYLFEDFGSSSNLLQKFWVLVLWEKMQNYALLAVVTFRNKSNVRERLLWCPWSE